LEQTARALARRVRARRAIDVASKRQPYRSEWVSLGLRRDLWTPFPAPAAKIPLTVRPLERRDYPALFDFTDPGLPEDERALRKSRGELAAEGVGQPFVAVTESGEPCYVQWLLSPADNDRLRAYFKGIFPRLAPDEALLEGAYTPAQYRGLGIMPAAMARIAEHGVAIGARWVVTFVSDDNIPSLKGCDRAGFSPFVRRVERWKGLRRTLTFTFLEDVAA
jgi:hypothetical protein